MNERKKLKGKTLKKEKLKEKKLKEKRRKEKSSEAGQMSIFIALIFQVLFVFFAMVINVGLLVHHKINLQNSVDIGAYYAASKQAELLNAIAHQNYQIRQAWKLLSWRYRVLGPLGAEDHPGNIEANSISSWRNFEGRWRDPRKFPGVCVNFNPVWKLGGSTTEDVCATMYDGYEIPRIPQTPNIGSVVGGLVDAVNRASQITSSNVGIRCHEYGPKNWQMAALFLRGFRREQANRKGIIYRLAQAMNGGDSDFFDLDNQSVLQGVIKTIQKNLTGPNQEGLDNGEGVAQVDVFNSMGVEGCNQRANWLNEMKTHPALYYLDFQTTGTAISTGCDSVKGPEKFKNVVGSPDPVHWQQYYNATTGIDRQILDILKREMSGEEGGLRHSSLGVEKNPWCMNYVGVRASTTPKIPFSPMGDVMLTATAFAKPFGGRIGPWHGKNWSRGQICSTGEKIDKLWPDSMCNQAQASGPDAGYLRQPNYSRFPGDTLGLNSRLVARHYGKIIYGNRGNPYPGLSLYHGTYNVALHDINGSGRDTLVFPSDDGLSDQEKADINKLRDLEIAAMAPDIFDITYYSVEPKFQHNYITRMEAAGPFVYRGGGGAQFLRGDMGFRYRDRSYSEFTVKDQIIKFNEITQLDKTQLGHQITNPEHLLTGWTQWSAKDQEFGRFPKNHFARCGFSPDTGGGKPDNPGDCVTGGRTGYSVKLVSKDYLKSDLALGGENNGGRILNPPPDW